MLTSRRLFVGILHLLAVSRCFSQETMIPNSSLLVEEFDTSVSNRQNFCQENSDVQSGAIELRDALVGRTLNVGIVLDSAFVNYANETEGINAADPGVLIEIWDELAKRAGFSWRDSFAFVNTPSGGKDWTDVLLWSIHAFDVSLDWWYPTTERDNEGAIFPEGWYDGDMIIIAKADDEVSDSFSFTSWTDPFTPNVWILMIFTLVISGVVAYWLEGKSGRKQLAADAPFRGSMISAATSYVYKSFIVVTGHTEIQPRSHSGQMISFSLAFFFMLLFSAYTANLASFLVVQQNARATNVNTVKDIVELGKIICVYKGGAVEDEIMKIYPDAKFAEINSANDDDVMIALQEDKCDFAVVGQTSWDSGRRKKSVNENCKLERIGLKFEELDASFALRSDAGVLCTSLVRDVLNIHLKEMKDELLNGKNFIEIAWEKFFVSIWDISDSTCSAEESASDSNLNESSDTLNLTNLGGIFVFHFFFLGTAIIIGMAGHFYGKEEKNKKNNDHLRATADPRRKLSKSYIDNLHSHTKSDIDLLNQRVTNVSELSRHVDSRIDALATSVEDNMQELREMMSLILHEQNEQKNNC